MTFINERSIKAVRKRTGCDACGKYIEIGEPATRWAGLTDGMFCAIAYHPECRVAEVALNKLHGTYSDEWMGLADLEWDDHRWLLENHPLVAERKGITLRRIEADERDREACRVTWAEIERKRREAAKRGAS